MADLRRVGIVGGETHCGEVLQFQDKLLDVVGVVVRKDQRAKVVEEIQSPLFDSLEAMLEKTEPDVLFVANENDNRSTCILKALEVGCDVIVDKPMAITMDQHRQIEEALIRYPERRLLMLLTLRGQNEWAGLRECVQDGRVGDVAHCRVRMAVRLKAETRPPWFLDSSRSGGLFLDLLIHGIDMVEWTTSRRIVTMVAVMGNLGNTQRPEIRDHAAVFCELDNGGSAIIEGQRMLPQTKGSDYRMTVVGTQGYVDLRYRNSLKLTSPDGAEEEISDLGDNQSVVGDWLKKGTRTNILVPQAACLRANRLAILATMAAANHQRWSSVEK